MHIREVLSFRNWTKCRIDDVIPENKREWLAIIDGNNLTTPRNIYAQMCVHDLLLVRTLKSMKARLKIQDDKIMHNFRWFIFSRAENIMYLYNFSKCELSLSLQREIYLRYTYIWYLHCIIGYQLSWISVSLI